MRAAIYARVSTAKQAEQNISIPDQVARCQAYAAQRGYSVVEEFIEAGASGRDGRRPQFQKMIDQANAKPVPFDVILIHSYSRFFRDEIELELYRRRLEKYGVGIVSITQEFGDGPGSEVARRIIALTDEMRSKEDAKHVCRGMIENARQGFWNGASAPFGYKTEFAEKRGDKIKKRLAIDPTTAETVKLIFKLFLEGDGTTGPIGIKAIAEWLNARGYNTPKGGRYYTSRIHAILTNETYTGSSWFNRKNSQTKKTRPREEWIKVSVPQIIQADMFHRVQMLLHEKSPKRMPPRLVSNSVLLSGVARCESCGKPLMMTTGKGGAYRYYRCASKHLKGSDACGQPTSMREERLDEAVMSALTGQLLTPERTRKIVAAVAEKRASTAQDNNHVLRQLRGNLAHANKRIRNLLDAVAEGLAGDTELFREKLSEAEKDRNDLIRLIEAQEKLAKADLKPITPQQAEIASYRLRDLLRDAPPDLKKRYVRNFVSGIVVGKSSIEITGPKSAVAEAMNGTPPANIASAAQVRSSIREWRT